MKIILYQIIIIHFLFQQSCFSQKKIEWKIYDHDFNMLTKISTKEVSIAHDLIWYRARGKYGVMDMRQNILIKPKYENIQHYPGGFTTVEIKNCFGMVYKGKEILPLKYSHRFSVDSSGYFIAEEGCSENPEAYIISRPSIHDKTGKLISQGCEGDINKLFIELTKRQKKQPYSEKKVSNGFTLKLMPPDQKYFKKGIYNHKDSLIFSCSKCYISDNVNGEFFIKQLGLNNVHDYEAYTIDTLGAIKIRGNYDRLYYNPKYNLYLYERGNERGLIDINGISQILTKTNISTEVQLISRNRFLLSFRDSLNTRMFTICDLSGSHLFTPTKDWFHIISDNCLVRETADGYFFTDADGKPVSGTYDSVFAIPDFNYGKMVLGYDYTGSGSWCSVGGISHLDHDGFSPVIKTPMTDFYGVEREGKKGFFNAANHTEVLPLYSLIAKVNKNLFVAKRDNQWFTMNAGGDLRSYKKCKYINFFENYILAGN